MSVWIREAVGILRLLFGEPGRAMFYIEVIVALLAYLSLFLMLGGLFSFGRGDLSRSILGTLAGMVIMLAGTVAARRYVHPSWLPRDWLLPGAALIVLAAAVVPIYCALVKSNYLRVALAVIVSGIGAVVVVLLVDVGVRAVIEGEESLLPARQRRIEIERYGE